MKWTPDTVIALVIVVGCLALRFCGIDSEASRIIYLAAGWAFGAQYQARKIGGG